MKKLWLVLLGFLSIQSGCGVSEEQKKLEKEYADTMSTYIDTINSNMSDLNDTIDIGLDNPQNLFLTSYGDLGSEQWDELDSIADELKEIEVPKRMKDSHEELVKSLEESKLGKKQYDLWLKEGNGNDKKMLETLDDIKNQIKNFKEDISKISE